MNRKAWQTGKSTGIVSLLLLMALALGGCKTGESTDPLPDTSAPSTSRYNGPAPATDDVQNFKLALWDNLAGDNRCGACHASGGQSPAFVHDLDINTAYSRANPLVDLDNPGDSALVAKVAAGHNCWLASDQACADTMENYIANWAGGAAGSIKRIELKAPRLRDPGASKTFPDNSSEFGVTVYPLLAAYCSDCHMEGDQSPYLASHNEDIAYDAARSRISLDNPSASRLVERLRDESHNCWDDDCAGSATEMQGAIALLADTITPQSLDPDLVASKALALTTDGLVANTGGRFDDHLVAFYEFKTGAGVTAFDTSGVEPALHLSLIGNVSWVGGWGIEFGPAYTDEDTGAEVRSGKAQGPTSASRKLHDLLTASGEYSIEAWVVPGNITQEEARIITYSGSGDARNVTLNQTLQNYEVLQRSTTTDQNTPFATADGDTRVQASLQHVVINFTPGEGRRIFINGEDTGDIDPTSGGLLNEWDDSFAFVLGNETDGQAPWEGALRLVAVHNRALSPAQIRSNHEAGVGQKYFLLFGVSHLIDVPQSYIVFEVSQFDSYSYLFSSPFFISLDEDAEPGGIPLQGMKLGINGREAVVGQSYANLDLTLNSSDYEAGRGQPLSRLGAIIGLESGPDSDEFFLSFERLGQHTNIVVEPSLAPEPVPLDRDPAPDIGLKTFDAINASMSRVTGVPVTRPQVVATFTDIRQQLPTVASIDGFLSSQQMAVTQLAIRYCDALVEDTSLRSDYFAGFDFNAPAGSAFDTSGRELIIDALLGRMVGTNLDTQPTDSEMRPELNNLMDTLTDCGGSCAADRTRTVVKASCAAVLGSAVTLVQ